MDTMASFPRTHRGRGAKPPGAVDHGGRISSKNKTWVSADVANARSGTNTSSRSGADADRWERGGHHSSRGRGTGRGGRFSRSPLPESVTHSSDEGSKPTQNGGNARAEEVEHFFVPPEEPELNTQEEREAFYKEVRRYFCL
jgi:nuclear mRNA export protein SAC3